MLCRLFLNALEDLVKNKVFIIISEMRKRLATFPSLATSKVNRIFAIGNNDMQIIKLYLCIRYDCGYTGAMATISKTFLVFTL